jgi:hypothetical protein
VERSKEQEIGIAFGGWVDRDFRWVMPDWISPIIGWRN